jgi:L-2-hydroxyglutarate oxidase LhgO
MTGPRSILTTAAGRCKIFDSDTIRSYEPRQRPIAKGEDTSDSGGIVEYYKMTDSFHEIIKASMKSSRLP